MKKSFVLFSALALIAASIVAFRPGEVESIALGTALPKADVKMKSIQDKDVQLKELIGNNGLLVIFSCNTCPFVVGAEGYGEGWEGRYAELKTIADANKVGMVLINSNEAKREKGDNLEDMKARAKDHGFANIPYVLDQNSVIADAFGAKTTPHVFLFDKNMKLVYKGAIDDSNESPSKVKEHYLKNALNNVAKGAIITPNETRPVGCGIKRLG